MIKFILHGRKRQKEKKRKRNTDSNKLVSHTSLIAWNMSCTMRKGHLILFDMLRVKDNETAFL